MRWYWAVVAFVHGLFMLAEFFPWPDPFLLQRVSEKLPPGPRGHKWTEFQQPLVATIVHNAGIYNAILAGGLCWAAWMGDPARDVARVLLAGAAVAGIFGTATLKCGPQ